MVFRHPLHPPLVHFPIAFLIGGSAADAAWLAGLTGDAAIGWWLIAAGLAAALVAMLAGLADFARLDAALVGRAYRHMTFAGLAVSAYALSLYLRMPEPVPGRASLAAGFAGAALLAVAGFLGGELVFRFGAGRARD